MQSVTVQIEDSNEKQEFNNTQKFRSTKSSKQIQSHRMGNNDKKNPALLSTVKEDSRQTTVPTTVQKLD